MQVSSKHYFRMYQPSPSTIDCILDKKLLAATASRAGVAVLPSWDPEGPDNLKALTPTLPYPILIKPRNMLTVFGTTRELLSSPRKELIQQYQQFIDREEIPTTHLTKVRRPILQQFVRVGEEGVLSVTGSADKAGKHFVTRHATKIFQLSALWALGFV